MLEFGRAVYKLIGDDSDFARTLDDAEGRIKHMTGEIGQSLEKLMPTALMVGNVISVMVTAVTAVAAETTKQAIEFEKSFVGVRKTVSATEEGFVQLEAGLRNLASSQDTYVSALPDAHNQLNRIAELAGQLGIHGVNDILKFTETIGMLGMSTNLTFEDAAVQLAQFANIMNMSIDDFDRLGAVIAILGNNMAAQESEIVKFAWRLAGASAVVGLSEAQVMGYSAALASLGLRAEMGGNAFSRMMIEMDKAVKKGGESLKIFAKVSQTTTEQFRENFEQDAASAINAFIEGLGQIVETGGDVWEVLEGVGLADIRVRDTMLRLATGMDVVYKAQELAIPQWETVTELLRETGLFANTTASRYEMLKNVIRDSSIEIGNSFKNAFDPMLERLIDFVENVSPKVEDFFKSLGDWFAGLPPGMQDVITLLSALTAGITGLGAALAILKPLLGVIGGGILLLKAPLGIALGIILAIIGVAGLWRKEGDMLRGMLSGLSKEQVEAARSAQTIKDGWAEMGYAFAATNEDLIKQAEHMKHLEQQIASLNEKQAEAQRIIEEKVAAGDLLTADVLRHQMTQRQAQIETLEHEIWIQERIREELAYTVKTREDYGIRIEELMEGDRAAREAVWQAHHEENQQLLDKMQAAGTYRVDSLTADLIQEMDYLEQTGATYEDLGYVTERWNQKSVQFSEEVREALWNITHEAEMGLFQLRQSWQEQEEQRQQRAAINAITSLQDYEAKRADIIAKAEYKIGAAQKEEDDKKVARLRNQLDYDLEMHDRHYADSEALLERSLIVQQIETARARIQELKSLEAHHEQKIIRELINQAKMGNLSREDLKRVLGEMNVRLTAENVLTLKLLDLDTIKAESAENYANHYIKTLRDLVAAQLAVQENALADALDMLNNWTPPTFEPIPLPSFDIPEVGTGGGGGTARAPKEESVVEALDNTLGRLSRALDGAIETLLKLTEYKQQTARIKEAAAALGEDLRELITTLFPFVESFGGDGRDWRDIPKAVAEFAEWASTIIRAMSQMMDLVQQFSDFDKSAREWPDLEKWGARVYATLERMYQVLDRANNEIGRDALREAAMLSEIVQAILSIVSVSFEGMADLVEMEWPDLEAWGARYYAILERTWDVLRHTRAVIGKDALAEAAAIASDVKDILSVIGADFAAIQELLDETMQEGGLDLESWGAWLATIIYRTWDVLRHLRDEIGPEPLSDAAEIAEDVKDILSIIGGNFDSIQALIDETMQEGGLDLEAWGAWLAAIIYRTWDILRHLRAEIGPELLADAAEIAEDVKDILSIISVDFESIQTLIDETMQEGGLDLDAWGAWFATIVYRTWEILTHLRNEIGEEPLAEAAEIAASVKDILGIIGVDFAKIQALIDETTQEGGLDLEAWGAWLAAIIDRVVEVLNSVASSDQKKEAIEAAESVAADIKSILAVIGGNFASIQDLIDETSQEDGLNLEAWGAWLAAIIERTVEVLNSVASSEEKERAIEAAAKIATSVKDILSIVNTDFTKIQALIDETSQEGGLDLDAWGAWLAAIIERTVEVLNSVASSDAEKEAIRAAGEIADDVKKILAIIGVDFKSIRGLTEDIRKKGGLDLETWGAWLTAIFKRMVEVLNSVASTDAEKKAVTAAAEIADDLKSIAEAITAGVKALIDMAAWKGVIDIEDKMTRFRIAWQWIILDFERLRRDIGELEHEKVRDLANSLGAIADSLVKGLKFLTEVDKYTSPAEASLERFMEDVFAMFQRFERWARTEFPEGIDETVEATATAIGALMSGLNNALSLLKGLRGYVSPREQDIVAFEKDVQRIFKDFHDWVIDPRQGFTADSLELTQTFGNALTALMTGLNQALELLVGLKYFIRPTQYSMDSFSTAVKEIVIDFRDWVETELTEAQMEALGMFGNTLNDLVTGLSSALQLIEKLTDGKLPGVEEFRLKLQHFNTLLVIAIKSWQTWLQDELDPDIDIVITRFSNIIGGMVEGLGSALGFLENLEKAKLPSPAKLKEYLELILEIFRALSAGMESVADDIDSAVTMIGAELASAPNALPNPSTWYATGRAYAISLADGIRSGIPNLQGEMDKVRGLMPSSPAKWGPFKNLPTADFVVDWMADLQGAFTTGLSAMNAMPAFAPPMAVAPGGGIGNVILNGPWHVRNDSDIRKIAQAVKQELSTEFRRNGGRM